MGDRPLRDQDAIWNGYLLVRSSGWAIITPDGQPIRPRPPDIILA
jgi:hypothetical protein